MPAQIIDGKAEAQKIYADLPARVNAFRERNGRPPGLAVVWVGEDPASQVYVRNKRKKSEELGLASFKHDLPATTSEDEVLTLIERLNQDPAVDGILVQMPLPPQVSEEKIVHAISLDKDVDGFHPENRGRLFSGRPRFVPCTPAGIMTLLQSTGVALRGKKAVVVGRSLLVGKPVAMLLLQDNATVTMCHSRTENLDAECRAADILVVAVGKKSCVLGDWIKPGAVVIDVGINRDESGLCGDVAFEQARERAAFITPVPGGVGPMTIAMLMVNTLKAAEAREEINRS